MAIAAEEAIEGLILARDANEFKESFSEKFEECSKEGKSRTKCLIEGITHSNKTVVIETLGHDIPFVNVFYDAYKFRQECKETRSELVCDLGAFTTGSSILVSEIFAGEFIKVGWMFKSIVVELGGTYLLFKSPKIGEGVGLGTIELLDPYPIKSSIQAIKSRLSCGLIPELFQTYKENNSFWYKPSLTKTPKTITHTTSSPYGLIPDLFNSSKPKLQAKQIKALTTGVFDYAIDHQIDIDISKPINLQTNGRTLVTFSVPELKFMRGLVKANHGIRQLTSKLIQDTALVQQDTKWMYDRTMDLHYKVHEKSKTIHLQLEKSSSLAHTLDQLKDQLHPIEIKGLTDPIRHDYVDKYYETEKHNSNPNRSTDAKVYYDSSSGNWGISFVAFTISFGAKGASMGLCSIL